MDNVKGAQRAIEYLDGFTIKDQVLSVQVKLSKEELARKRERYTVSASRRLPLFFYSVTYTLSVFGSVPFDRSRDVIFLTLAMFLEKPCD